MHCYTPALLSCLCFYEKWTKVRRLWRGYIVVITVKARLIVAESSDSVSSIYCTYVKVSHGYHHHYLYQRRHNVHSFIRILGFWVVDVMQTVRK